MSEIPALAERIQGAGAALLAAPGLMGLLAMFFLRRWMLSLLIALLLLLVAVWSCALLNQDHMIFPGAFLPKTITPGPRDPRVQQIWITAADGCRIEGWYQLGRGRLAVSPGPAAIYFHANGDTVDNAAWILPHYARLGVSILVVEYRGYGRCDGEPSEKAIVADSVQFFDWLAKRPEVDPDRIILHGMSLGGGVAGAVAGERNAAALVLEATFTSIAALANRYLLPGSLCRHPFHSDRIIGKLDIPIAIFHGKHDATIPVSHGRKLHALAPYSRYTELNCGHHNYHNDFASMAAFLREAGVLRGD